MCTGSTEHRNKTMVSHGEMFSVHSESQSPTQSWPVHQLLPGSVIGGVPFLNFMEGLNSL